MNKIFRFCYNSSANSVPRREEKIKSGEENNDNKKNMNMGLKLKETFYVSHGSPTLAIDESIPAWNFFNS